MRLPTIDGQFYNFELRSDSGFDHRDDFPGVYARLSGDLFPVSPGIWAPTQLIDFSPQDGDFHHAAMPDGFVFVDPFTGNRVELMSESSHEAVLTVTLSSPGMTGDVDCSGGVNSVDALMILRSVAGLPVTADCLGFAGDVNCDGSINSVDALGILRYVAALPLNLPGGCPPIGQ